MLRLAGEAGMRRGEVARVHTRDLLESTGGAQLVVHGLVRQKRYCAVDDDEIRGAMEAAGF
jgi:hypothetical protein